MVIELKMPVLGLTMEKAVIIAVGEGRGRPPRGRRPRAGGRDRQGRHRGPLPRGRHPGPHRRPARGRGPGGSGDRVHRRERGRPGAPSRPAPPRIGGRLPPRPCRRAAAGAIRATSRAHHRRTVVRRRANASSLPPGHAGRAAAQGVDLATVACTGDAHHRGRRAAGGGRQERAAAARWRACASHRWPPAWRPNSASSLADLEAEPGVRIRAADLLAAAARAECGGDRGWRPPPWAAAPALDFATGDRAQFQPGATYHRGADDGQLADRPTGDVHHAGRHDEGYRAAYGTQGQAEARGTKLSLRRHVRARRGHGPPRVSPGQRPVGRGSGNRR